MTAEASCHGDTAPTTPEPATGRRHARADRLDRISEHRPGRRGSGPCSGSSCTSNAVNTDRTVSALPAERAQPAPHRRCRPAQPRGDRPVPGTGGLRRSAAPITSTASARRSRHDTAQQHMRHQAAGRSGPGAAAAHPTPRTVRAPGMPPRARAAAARANQLTSPTAAARPRPTSVPTMTTGASNSTKERPSLPAKERGGPLRFHERDQLVVAHEQGATRPQTL